MKLSNETLSILKNFAGINQNLWVLPGNQLSTITPAKSIFAKAEIAETFPQEFGIYDLGKFLGVLSLFQEPEIAFEDKFMMIGQGKNKIRYAYAAKSILCVPPEKNLNFPQPEVQVQISAENLAQVTKAAAVLGVTDVSVQGSDGNCELVAHSIESGDSDEFRLHLGDSDSVYRMDFKLDTLRVIPGNYDVDISSKRISRFTNKDIKLHYFIACAQTSTYEG